MNCNKKRRYSGMLKFTPPEWDARNCAAKIVYGQIGMNLFYRVREIPSCKDRLRVAKLALSKIGKPSLGNIEVYRAFLELVADTNRQLRMEKHRSSEEFLSMNVGKNEEVFERGELVQTCKAIADLLRQNPDAIAFKFDQGRLAETTLGKLLNRGGAR